MTWLPQWLQWLQWLQCLSTYLTSALSIAHMEVFLFARYPRLWLAAAVVVVIPALYVVIYLTSVWDPAAHTSNLPVAIVNLDRGLEYRQQTFNVGRDVTARLKAKPGFGYLDMTHEQEARRLVRQGKLAFALIVPEDFSSNAVPGAHAGAGKLVIYTSEGNSYPSAGLARRFAEDLGREVNQSLNEQRWALVLADAAGSQRSLNQLRESVAQLRWGAKELVMGAGQVAKVADNLSGGAVRIEHAIGQLTMGVKELGNGVKTLYAQRPKNADLTRLGDGARALAQGHDEMGRGLDQLASGASRLQASMTTFAARINDSVLVPDEVRQAVTQLGQGLFDLDVGLKTASTSHQKLALGAQQLNTGVQTLSTGIRSLNAALHSLDTQWPDSGKLDELSNGADNLAHGSVALKNGTQKVTTGAQHLLGAIDLLETSLPANLRTMDGNAQGLANSVSPTMEVEARVRNNGSGFAPNIIPGALWLGASLAAFLIHIRRLPRQAVRFSAVARFTGKVLLPLGLVLLQALLVWVSVRWFLQIQVQDMAALGITLTVSSATFLLIVLALTHTLGDAGKALALVLLAVQLSSSGGILPVELSGGLFAQISPYLPITWVVKAIKASLFGAFEGGWLQPVQWVGLAGLAAATVACYVGRWRFVQPSALRPALDL